MPEKKEGRFIAIEVRKRPGLRDWRWEVTEPQLRQKLGEVYLRQIVPVIIHKMKNGEGISCRGIRYVWEEIETDENQHHV